MFLRSLEINHANRTCPSLSKTWSEENWEKDVKFHNLATQKWLSLLETQLWAYFVTIWIYQGLLET